MYHARWINWFALKPILINLTEHLTLSSIEVLFFKIVQVLMIFVICCLVQYSICKFLPKADDRHLTGGR